jgi:hypothetical protein
VLSDKLDQPQTDTFRKKVYFCSLSRKKQNFAFSKKDFEKNIFVIVICFLDLKK